MKFKIAVEVELDLTGKNTEMVEANPDKFCEEFAKTLASYATEGAAEQGAKCVYVDHAWIEEDDKNYSDGVFCSICRQALDWSEK